MKKGIRLVSYKFVKLMKQVFLVSVFCMAMSFQTGTARADLPVTGVEVSELTEFDTAMQDIMNSNGLEGGVLAVSKDGCVVYQRGFGYAHNGTDPLPENTPMRLASVEKPLTAAVIRDLVADGVISLNDFVFDVGQWSPLGERRLLDAHLPSSTYWPYNDVYGDDRFGSIRVEHLLLHQGGWDIGVLGYDPQYSCIDIANAMGIDSPPGRVNTTRYMLSQPLQYTPGTLPCDRDGNDDCLETPPDCYCGTMYSNFGFMLLGLIIEEETGANVAAQVHNRILTPEMWVPATEVFTGMTFRDWQNLREPYYFDDGWVQNVFDPDPFNLVRPPYGGWEQWALQGHGNTVSSAAPLLEFLDNYVVIGNDIGMPLVGFSGWRAHGGAMAGTNTVALQRGDSINIVVLLNERHDDALDDILTDIMAIIDDTVNPLTWPTARVDGFWLDFNASSSGYGGHDDPFNTVSGMLNATSDGTKLRIKGSSNWTGTISTRMLLDAPSGTAIIGQ